MQQITFQMANEEHNTHHHLTEYLLHILVDHFPQCFRRLAHSQEGTASSYRITLLAASYRITNMCHVPQCFLVASRILKRVQTSQHPAASTAKCRRGAPRALGLVQCLCTGRWHAPGPSQKLPEGDVSTAQSTEHFAKIKEITQNIILPNTWFTLRWTIFHNFSCRLAHSQEDTTSSYRIIAAHFDGPFSTICFSSPRALSRGHNIILPKIQTLAAHFDGTFSTIVLVASRTLKRVQTTQHLTASTAKCHRGAPRALGLVQCLCTGRWHARGPS